MTIEQKYFELIQAAIDGEISSSDKDELDAFLAGSEEGRAVYSELVGLCQSLDGMPEIEPPPHLKHTLMNMAPTKSQVSPSPGFLERLFAGPMLGYIGVFAAGAVFTLAIVDSGQISRGAFDDVTGLVGTMSDADFVVPEHASISVDRSEVAGTVTLRSTGPILIVDFELSSRQPVEILAGYSDQSIWFNGFAQLESSGTSVAAETGLVRLEMDGNRRYAVYLNNPGQRPTTINLQFMAGGQVIHQAQLEYGETQ
jgi:hypothetical protein